MIDELKSTMRGFDIEYRRAMKIEDEGERKKKKKEILRKMAEMYDIIEKVTERVKEMK